MEFHELTDSINSVLKLQEEQCFIQTGLYLAPDQISLISTYLQPDDPPTGAVGRFEGVPIFGISDYSISNDVGGRVSKYGIHGGIRYRYVKMDFVN